jgi:hypothetical protein
MKSFSDYVKSRVKSEAFAKPDREQDDYDDKVDRFMDDPRTRKSQLMGNDPEVPPDLVAQGRAASAFKPMPRPAKTLPAEPEPTAFHPDDRKFKSGVERAKEAIAHLAPGMVLRAVLPALGDSKIIEQLLEKYGEEAYKALQGHV